jgi:death on curing protein
MSEPSFLTLEEILFIHQQEIQISGGDPTIRDKEGVKACVDAPKVSFGGDYLYDLFGMAASYIASLAIRHPFLDGKKRTALVSSLTFLHINAYTISESHEEELADLVLDFVTKKISKEEIAEHFRSKCVER